MTIAIVTALRIAGLNPRTLAVGGAVTAVIVGLAAQQTFANVMAGGSPASARRSGSVSASGFRAAGSRAPWRAS